MFIYLVVFSLSIIFTRLAERSCNKNRHKIITVVFSILAITIPSILAAMRADIVGTDINNYVKPLFEYFCKNGFSTEYMQKIGIEYLYGLLTYIVTIFTDDIRVLLFVVEFLIISLIYLSAYYRKDKIPMWMFMFVFFTVFYNSTLNLVRQSIALAIVIYSFKYIENKNCVKFLFSVYIATLFHSTAFFAIILYVIYNSINTDLKNLYKIIIISLCILMIFFYRDIISILIDIGLIPTKFNSYLTKYLKESVDLDIIASLFKITIIVFVYFAYKILIKREKNNEYYILLLVIDFILLQLSAFIDYADRISYYFGLIAQMVLIPQLIFCVKKDRFNKIIAKLIIIIMLLCYWYIRYIYYNNGETYPYIFR